MTYRSKSICFTEHPPARLGLDCHLGVSPPGNLGVLRRHLATREHLGNLKPDFGPTPNLRQRRKPLEIQFAFLLLARMAVETRAPQQRPNVPIILGGQRVERCRFITKDEERTKADAQAAASERLHKTSFAMGGVCRVRRESILESDQLEREG